MPASRHPEFRLRLGSWSAVAVVAYTLVSGYQWILRAR